MRYRKIGNVICDPTSEEAKALVGKKVVYGDAHADLSKRLRYPDIGRLERICEERPHPFFIVRSDDYGSPYFKMICAVEVEPEEKHYREYTKEEAIKLIGRVYRTKDETLCVYRALNSVMVDGTKIAFDGWPQPIFMDSYEWYAPETGETEPIGVEVEDE